MSPGDQVNMAFMNTPVTHGSGVMIVTATAAQTELGKISGMLSTTATEQSPLTKELNRLTLWIVAAAGLTMVVMFALGRSRNTAWDVLFVSAVSLAIAAIPEALPTVTEVILSLGSVELAKRNALVKGAPRCRDARVHLRHQLGQDRHPHLEPDDGCRGASIRPIATPSAVRVTAWRAGSSIRPALPTRSRMRSCPSSSPTTPRWSRARSSAIPQRARCWSLDTRPGWTSMSTRAAPAEARHAPVRPHLQAHGHLPRSHRFLGTPDGPLLRQGGRTGRDGPLDHCALRRFEHPLGRRSGPPGPEQRRADGRPRSAGHGRGHARHRRATGSTPRATCSSTCTTCR